MISHKENNLKLGIFVLSALILTIIGLYLIGKNKSLFGANFELKARFSNLNGLTSGNNVLYSGLQAGTVKDISVINDTTFEVSMFIDDDLKPFIHTNALVSIGTEGLMGNKVIQISPGKGASPVVARGDILKAKNSVAMDEMLQTLSRTNENISQISEILKVSVLRINKSEIWNLLEEDETSRKLKLTVENIHQTSAHANKAANNIDWLIEQTKQGKGAAGMILTDTTLSLGLSRAVASLSSASSQADELTKQLNLVVNTLSSDINNGPGLLNTLLKDTLLSRKLDSSLNNIEKGTDGFNQSMEALKHNFLLRGYFKKLAKEKGKVRQP
jgi:phospholipid/cholesterol/gamma-HCH transport system substrate-binding protein